jgi:hypothetical protein
LLRGKLGEALEHQPTIERIKVTTTPTTPLSADITQLATIATSLNAGVTQLAKDYAASLATVTPPPPTNGAVLPLTDGSQSGYPTAFIFDDEMNSGQLHPAWANSWFGNTEKQNNTVMKTTNVKPTTSGLQLILAGDKTGGIVSTNPNDGQHGSQYPGFQFAPAPGRPVFAEYAIDCPANAAGTINGWPAGWFTGQDWPEDGEIDDMEGLGGTDYFSIHYGTGNELSQQLKISAAPGLHTYGVFWTVTALTCYLDGKNEGTLTEALTNPMYAVMEYSLGSGVVETPATMIARHLRIWQDAA